MIINPGWLVIGADVAPKRGWGVRVVGSQISAVDTADNLRANFRDDEVLDAPDSVCLPGFVNAHTHTYGVLAHGIDVNLPPDGFESFLEDYWWPQVEDALDHQMISAAIDWACSEMLLSGTTTFLDILEAPNSLPDALLVEKDVVERRGIRGVLSFEATERAGSKIAQLGLDENLNLAKACDPGGLVSAMMSFHTTFTCSANYIRKAFELGSAAGLSTHAHVNESHHEGQYCEKTFDMSTLAYYESLGVLGPDFLASQCVQITDRDLELIAGSGMRVSHMPLSNCEVGGGIAPIPELTQAGVIVGLGSDGYINDFYEVMRGSFLVGKARALDPGAMPADLVFNLATEGAAKAIGLDKVGRLEVGWSADLQVLDARLPTPLTEHNLLEQIILWRSQHHVNDVMVAGQWRVRDGQLLDADTDQIRAKVGEQAKRMWNQ